MQHSGKTTQLLVIVAALAISCATVSAQQEPTIWFVDASVSSSGNGEEWGTAFATLQEALDEAQQGHEIWVAEGVYKPTVKTDPTDDRSATFLLLDDVGIYGGFAGFETDLWQRKPKANPTILSGRIGNNDPDDNAYHVVTGVSAGPSTILSGFTIRDGNADGTGSIEVGGFPVPRDEGGGVFLRASSMIIAHCRFVANCAAERGDHLAILGGSPIIVDCVFIIESDEPTGREVFQDEDSRARFEPLVVQQRRAG